MKQKSALLPVARMVDRKTSTVSHTGVRSAVLLHGNHALLDECSSHFAIGRLCWVASHVVG